MELNQECIRDLLIYVEQYQPVRSTGITEPFKVKFFCADENAPKYENGEIALAVKYLTDKKLIECSNPNSGTAHIQIKRITAKGYDYLGLIRDQSMWRALKAFRQSVRIFPDRSLSEMLLKAVLSHLGLPF